MTDCFDQGDATDRHDTRAAGDRDPVVWAGPVAVFFLTSVSALAWMGIGAMAQAVL